MPEPWLHANRRVLLLGTIPPGMAAVGCLVLVVFSRVLVLRVAAGLLLALLLVLIAAILLQLLRPRVAYRPGEVLFYLNMGRPIAVPVQYVEGFFLGQGPAHLPGGESLQTKSVNLVARLSQREAEWHERPVKPALGSWKEGYVTIRGTWCEPLNVDTVRRINHRLHEVSKVSRSEDKVRSC